MNNSREYFNQSAFVEQSAQTNIPKLHFVILFIYFSNYLNYLHKTFAYVGTYVFSSKVYNLYLKSCFRNSK